jgi:hypothetical protein
MPVGSLSTTISRRICRQMEWWPNFSVGLVEHFVELAGLVDARADEQGGAV